jgi:hypothetical protein
MKPGVGDRPVSARTKASPYRLAPGATRACTYTHHRCTGEECHRGPPGNRAMREHDSGRAHAIPAAASIAALSRLRRRDGAYPRDPAGRISSRTTHFRVPGLQRRRYPGSAIKLVVPRHGFFAGRWLELPPLAGRPSRGLGLRNSRDPCDLPFPVDAKRRAMAETHGRRGDSPL